MKITKRQLRKLIKEGSGDVKSTLYGEVPSITLVGDPGWDGEGPEIMTLNPTDADTLEGLIAQCYDVADEMLMKLEIGESRANATGRVGIDARLQGVTRDLEDAMEALYTVQMGLSHLRDGTGG